MLFKVDVRTGSGVVVRNLVLQPQPDAHEDLNSAVVQAHLHIHLDSKNDTSRVGLSHGHWDMACGVGMHSVRTTASLLGLVSLLDDHGLLPTWQYVVGQWGSPYRERPDHHGPSGTYAVPRFALGRCSDPIRCRFSLRSTSLGGTSTPL
jgi:hypothetical protein